MPSQRIHRLVLDAFRNYQNIAFAFDEVPIIFVGENGAGKTNILEAISLLSPGRGLRRAALPDLQNNDIPHTHPWALFYECHGRKGDIAIGIGRDPESAPGEDKRILRIDGKPAKSQSALAEHVQILWLTPDMDRLLADGTAPRRRFMDRLTFALDHQHLTRFNLYEDAMRARARLLRDGIQDDVWLSALEDTMAKNGLALAAARMHWAEEILAHLLTPTGDFPCASLRVEGYCETLLQTHAALDAEDILKTALKKNRPSDAQSGTTEFGVHRSNMAMTHETKNTEAHLCSTGEQKALLISLILAQTKLLTRLQGSTPIILLDDITAHLDEHRRHSLCAQLLDMRAQAFLTGTDAALFDGLRDHAQFHVISHSSAAKA